MNLNPECRANVAEKYHSWFYKGKSKAWSEKNLLAQEKINGGNRMSLVLSSSRLRSLVTKSPAAEKALSASTLVGGIDFNVERIFSIAGGSLPVASKL